MVKIVTSTFKGALVRIAGTSSLLIIPTSHELITFAPSNDSTATHTLCMPQCHEMIMFALWAICLLLSLQAHAHYSQSASAASSPPSPPVCCLMSNECKARRRGAHSEPLAQILHNQAREKRASPR